MIEIICEMDEIVSITKETTMNHPTKIKVNKHNEGYRATSNNLDNVLTWLLPFHATWTYGFVFRHKKKIVSKLLFAPQKNKLCNIISKLK